MWVVDTCALLFWTLEPGRLSRRARGELDQLGPENRGILVSAALWEIAVKAKAGRLGLGLPVDEYCRRLRRLPLDIEPIDTDLWLASVDLDWPHRDPVDRLVVALARRHGAGILTSDEVIRGFATEAVW